MSFFMSTTHPFSYAAASQYPTTSSHPPIPLAPHQPSHPKTIYPPTTTTTNNSSFLSQASYLGTTYPSAASMAAAAAAAAAPPRPLSYHHQSNTSNIHNTSSSSSSSSSHKAGASSAPFRFRSCTHPVNWERILAIDLNQVRRDTDVDVLQQVVKAVTFADISHVPANGAPAVAHLFQIAQLIMQYLLYTQDALSDICSRRSAQIKELRASLREGPQSTVEAQQKQQIEKLQTEVALLRQELVSCTSGAQQQQQPSMLADGSMSPAAATPPRRRASVSLRLDDSVVSPGAVPPPSRPPVHMAWTEASNSSSSPPFVPSATAMLRMVKEMVAEEQRRAEQNLVQLIEEKVNSSALLNTTATSEQQQPHIDELASLRRQLSDLTEIINRSKLLDAEGGDSKKTRSKARHYSISSQCSTADSVMPPMMMHLGNGHTPSPLPSSEDDPHLLPPHALPRPDSAATSSSMNSSTTLARTISMDDRTSLDIETEEPFSIATADEPELRPGHKKSREKSSESKHRHRRDKEDEGPEATTKKKKEKASDKVKEKKPKKEKERKSEILESIPEKATEDPLNQSTKSRSSKSKERRKSSAEEMVIQQLEDIRGRTKSGISTSISRNRRATEPSVEIPVPAEWKGKSVDLPTAQDKLSMSTYSPDVSRAESDVLHVEKEKKSSSKKSKKDRSDANKHCTTDEIEDVGGKKSRADSKLNESSILAEEEGAFNSSKVTRSQGASAPAMEACSYCGTKVSAESRVVHESMCPKRTGSCKYCRETVPLAHVNDPKGTGCPMWVNVECDLCRQKFPMHQISAHRLNCADREEECQYCGRGVPFAKIREHMADCEYCPVPCPHCHKEVTAKNLILHKNSCPAVLAAIKAANEAQQLQSQSLMTADEDSDLSADESTPVKGKPTAESNPTVVAAAPAEKSEPAVVEKAASPKPPPRELTQAEKDELEILELEQRLLQKFGMKCD